MAVEHMAETPDKLADTILESFRPQYQNGAAVALERKKIINLIKNTRRSLHHGDMWRTIENPPISTISETSLSNFLQFNIMRTRDGMFSILFSFVLNVR
jgi:hypothetical protein